MSSELRAFSETRPHPLSPDSDSTAVSTKFMSLSLHRMGREVIGRIGRREVIMSCEITRVDVEKRYGEPVSLARELEPPVELLQ